MVKPKGLIVLSKTYYEAYARTRLSAGEVCPHSYNAVHASTGYSPFHVNGSN